ncbi:hypothetical protein HAX54_029143 [Datura stramonium]|uniref:F-box associated beta-propeller type 1 domain-containing protein n=1 Tax=Datura stramonium TaxID=4076 RepID=A0ABS8V8N2_DATST|nr:hypothetical protein [Datura stramonium]
MSLIFFAKIHLLTITLLGSCDGLFCISTGSHDLFLWNPSIRKLKELPFSGSNVHCSSYLAYGVGYNECQDDYKVVEVMGCSHSDYGFINEFRVYNLRTNSWEMILEYPSVIFCNDPAKFVNGRLHWIATRVTDKNDSWFVSSLNLMDKSYEKVALPDLDDGNFDWELGTLGGNLSVFCDCYKVRMDVWVTKKAYGLVESWTKVASIPYFTAIEHSMCPVFISIMMKFYCNMVQVYCYIIQHITLSSILRFRSLMVMEFNFVCTLKVLFRHIMWRKFEKLGINERMMEICVMVFRMWSCA